MRKVSNCLLVLLLSLLLSLSGLLSTYAANPTALSLYVKSCAGDSSVIALKSDGTVWTWGRNDVGQLGDGTEGMMNFRTVPSMVNGISDAIDIATDGGFSMVLKKDGTVWAWGIWGRATEKGEYSLIPVRVEGFSNIKAVAAGSGSIIALKKDGTVWALETNPMLKDYSSDDYDSFDDEYIDGYYDYDIGEKYASNGSEYELLMESRIPYQIKNLEKIKSISTYGNYTGGAYAAVKEDGTVWTWGAADYEQAVNRENYDPLSQGSLDDSDQSYYIPSQVKGISNVVMVAPAEEHMLALKNDGTVWTWGVGMDLANVGPNNMFSGKLKYIPPTQIPGLANVAYIAAVPDEIIMNSAIAVKKDGTVWRMHLYTGRSYSKVEPLSGVKSVAAGREFILFTKSDGTIWSCGNNDYGQLGNGFNSFTQIPEKLTSIDNVKAMATGANNSIALKVDGTVWHWGTFNQVLGTGADFKANQLQYTKPALINDFNGITKVSAGNNMITMVKNDGTGWSMGGNFSGELGDGTNTFSTKPVKISGLNGVKDIYNIKVGQYDYSIALMSDGTLRSWGYNHQGQLGDGTKVSKSAPVTIKGISNVVSVALAGDFALALKNDGTVWGWGSNLDGNLGKGVKVESLTPIKVNNLSEVISIATCGSTAMALKKDGTVWAWGYNGIGQLGQDTERIPYSLEPLKVPSLESVSDIAAGYGHMIALKRDGTVWAWGDTSDGSLDDLGYDKVHLVRQVPGLSSIIDIAAGESHSMALKNDGSLWVWGNNKGGQLGSGGADMFYPIKVIK